MPKAPRVKQLMFPVLPVWVLVGVKLELSQEKPNNLQSKGNANRVFQIKQLRQAASRCSTGTDHCSTKPFPLFFTGGSTLFLLIFSPGFSSGFVITFVQFVGLYSARQPDRPLTGWQILVIDDKTIIGCDEEESEL